MLKELSFLKNYLIYMNNKRSAPVCYSHIGQRTNHEDNFLINEFYLTHDLQKRMLDRKCYFVSDPVLSRVNLFAISDGMGGHQAGEVASRLCIEKLALAQKNLQSCHSIEEAVAYLQKMIMEINDNVCNLSCKQDELDGMGATLVVAVNYGMEYAILNLGDSRAYHFSNGKLIQITKDHTEGQRMLDLGLLTRKELSGFPARKNLNRYVGYSQSGYVLQADEYYPNLESGVLLLCSDGISDFISDARISEILRVEHDLRVAGKLLIEEAVSLNNADNATIILIPLGR